MMCCFFSFLFFLLFLLSLDGVKLNEGFVADEDTTIYNPGLTLLTSSEKERLVNALVDNRQIGLSTQHWSENNEYAFDFLKQKLDRKCLVVGGGSGGCFLSMKEVCLDIISLFHSLAHFFSHLLPPPLQN